MGNVEAFGDKLINGYDSGSEIALLNDLSDVYIANLANGQILKYNSTSQKWENANESGGGSTTLAGLTDVTITNPTLGQVLIYDGTKWINYAINAGLFLAEYGVSTLAEVQAAFAEKRIVYCKASSNNDPSVGSKTRQAFLAYVDSEATPSEFEFQYYKSTMTHSNSTQMDEIYVYKLNSSGWSVSRRYGGTHIVAGTNMTGTYTSSKGGTLTLDVDSLSPAELTALLALLD